MTRETNYHFRVATKADLPRIAEIHKATFPPHYVTALLPLSALENYYGRFIGDGAEILLAVEPRESGEHILGMAVYGLRIGERIQAFKGEQRNVIALTAAKNPRVAGKKLFQQFTAKLRAGPDKPPVDFLFLSLAVEKKGGGVGKDLALETMKRASTDGHDIMGLYVNADNIGVINLHASHGFKIKQLRGDQYYMEGRTQLA